MKATGSLGRWRRPRVSTFPVLREAAARFTPPLEIYKEEPGVGRLILHDPTGRYPKLQLSHRYQRRLFIRTNYMHVASSVPGDGPAEDGELVFRFKGPFSRQKGSLKWAAAMEDGERWLSRLNAPLVEAASGIEAVQTLQIRWSARRRIWRLELETMSGSVVSGLGAFVPVAVPFDRREAEAVLAAIEALGATAG